MIGGSPRLAGKVALVTGGNTGIGRAVARAYADEGADVAIAWIAREADAASLMAEIEKRGRGALAVRCDVTREADVQALVGAVIERFGRIDVLVNNAGIQKPQALTETSLDDWERMMAVHLRGAFLVRRLDFLQADDVGTLLLEPIEQPRKPAVDAVNVIGSELQHQARSLETTSGRIDAETSKVRAFRFDGGREAGHTRVAVLLPHAINSSREMQVAKRKKAKKGKKK